jgi:hypothetical protein
VALTAHHHLAPRIKKEESYLSLLPVGLQGLFWGELLIN